MNKYNYLFIKKIKLVVLSLLKVLKFLSSLSPYLNNVEQLLLRDSLSLVADDLEVFILQTSRMLTNLGVKVLLPKELR